MSRRQEAQIREIINLNVIAGHLEYYRTESQFEGIKDTLDKLKTHFAGPAELMLTPALTEQLLNTVMLGTKHPVAHIALEMLIRAIATNTQYITTDQISTDKKVAVVIYLTDSISNLLSEELRSKSELRCLAFYTNGCSLIAELIDQIAEDKIPIQQLIAISLALLDESHKDQQRIDKAHAASQSAAVVSVLFDKLKKIPADFDCNAYISRLAQLCNHLAKQAADKRIIAGNLIGTLYRYIDLTKNISFVETYVGRLQLLTSLTYLILLPTEAYNIGPISSAVSMFRCLLEYDDTQKLIFNIGYNEPIKQKICALESSKDPLTAQAAIAVAVRLYPYLSQKQKCAHNIAEANLAYKQKAEKRKKTSSAAANATVPKVKSGGKAKSKVKVGLFDNTNQSGNGKAYNNGAAAAVKP